MPKRIVFGNLEGEVRRERDGKKKKLIDCVQSDVRKFGIAGDCKVAALEAGGGLGRSRRVGKGLWSHGA